MSSSIFAAGGKVVKDKNQLGASTSWHSSKNFQGGPPAKDQVQIQFYRSISSNMGGNPFMRQ
jgi:hypothetical protein